MKTAVAYLTKQSPVSLAIGAAVILGVLYVVGRAAVTEVAGVAAGIATGDNVITRNQSNAAGEKVTAYEGAGVVGTLGGAANSISGGALASIGETIGGWAFDIFGPKTPDFNKP